VATLWNGGQAPLISPQRALDVLDVPEDERADDLARIESLRNEAMVLEREMMEMQRQQQQQRAAQAKAKPAARK
jgi:hypothetical protein